MLAWDTSQEALGEYSPEQPGVPDELKIGYVGGGSREWALSDNYRRWFDLEHARSTVGQSLRDEVEAWDGPPTDDGAHDDP